MRNAAEQVMSQAMSTPWVSSPSDLCRHSVAEESRVAVKRDRDQTVVGNVLFSSETSTTTPKRPHRQDEETCNICVTTGSNDLQKIPSQMNALGERSNVERQSFAALQLLCNVFATASNALVEQKKYLPDSTVPVVPLACVPEGMENKIEWLMERYSFLLHDDMKKERAKFVALPSDVLDLLRGVWNLSHDPSQHDRVGKKMVPVQSFYPNLLNHLLRTPGFPVAAGSFDSDIFRPCGKKRVKEIEENFKQVICGALESMGYSCQGREIEFYLSFMKTKNRTVPQDAHVDFKFQTVDPWYAEESTTRHRGLKRGRRLEYSDRVPFIAFFPLTTNGMAVEVWEARKDHTNGREGVVVHIPFGCMMIARGDMVHAGGFDSGGSGNARCHLYIYRSGGEVHDINTSNTYKFEVDGKTLYLGQLYRHGQGV